MASNLLLAPSITEKEQTVASAIHSQEEWESEEEQYSNNNDNKKVEILNVRTSPLRSSLLEQSSFINQLFTSPSQTEHMHEDVSLEIISHITPLRVLSRLRSLLVQIVLYSASPLTPAQGIWMVKQTIDSVTCEMIKCIETSIRVLRCKKGQSWQDEHNNYNIMSSSHSGISGNNNLINNNCSQSSSSSSNITSYRERRCAEYKSNDENRTQKHQERFYKYIKSLAENSNELSSRLLLIGNAFERLYEQSVVQLIPQRSSFLVKPSFFSSSLKEEKEEQQEELVCKTPSADMTRTEKERKISNQKSLLAATFLRESSFVPKQQTLEEQKPEFAENDNCYWECPNHNNDNKKTTCEFTSTMTNKFNASNTIEFVRPTVYEIVDWILLGLMLTDSQLRISVYGNHICYPVQPSMLLATYDVAPPCTFLTSAYSLSRFTAKIKKSNNADNNNNNNNDKNDNDNNNNCSSNKIEINGSNTFTAAINNIQEHNTIEAKNKRVSNAQANFVEINPLLVESALAELSLQFPNRTSLRSHNVKSCNAKRVYNWTLAHSLFFSFNAFLLQNVINIKSNVIANKNNSNIQGQANSFANSEINWFTETKQEEMCQEYISQNKKSQEVESITHLHLENMYPLIRCVMAYFDQHEEDMLGTNRITKQQSFTSSLPELSNDSAIAAASSSSSSVSAISFIKRAFARERAITESAAKSCNEALNGASNLRNWVVELTGNKNIAFSNINNSGSTGSDNSSNDNLHSTRRTRNSASDEDLSLGGGTGVFANKLRTIGQRLNWESSLYSTNTMMLGKLFKYSVAVPISVARLAMLIRWNISAPFASTYQHCFIYFLLLYAANPSCYRMCIRETEREGSRSQLFNFLEDTEKRFKSRNSGIGINNTEITKASRRREEASKVEYSAKNNCLERNAEKEEISRKEWRNSEIEEQQLKSEEKEVKFYNQRVLYRSELEKRENANKYRQSKLVSRERNEHKRTDSNSKSNINSNNNKNNTLHNINSNNNGSQIMPEVNIQHQTIDKASGWIKQIREEYMNEYKTFRSAVIAHEECIRLIVFRILPQHRPWKAADWSNKINNNIICNQDKDCTAKMENEHERESGVTNAHFIRAYDAVNKYCSKRLYKYIEVLPTDTCTPRQILRYLQHEQSGNWNKQANMKSGNRTTCVIGNLISEEEYLLVYPLALSVLKRRIRLASDAITRHRLFCDYYVTEETRQKERNEGKYTESIQNFKSSNAHLYELTIGDLTKLCLWEHEYGQDMSAEMMIAYLRCFPANVELICPSEIEVNNSASHQKGKKAKVAARTKSSKRNDDIKAIDYTNWYVHFK